MRKFHEVQPKPKINISDKCTPGPADFKGADFTCAHFQKQPKYPAYAIFTTLSEGIPSLMRFWKDDFDTYR